MGMGKGLAFSVVGAAAVAALWGFGVVQSEYSLWLLAPLVGGAAGYGMSRGTEMRGGVGAGIAAALVTILVIFCTRAVVAREYAAKVFAVDEQVAIDSLATDVAGEMDAAGEEYTDEDGEYLPVVMDEARGRWDVMSESDRAVYMKGLRDEGDQASLIFAPILLIFDFGIIGTICTALSAGAAYQGASKSLEAALIEKGQAETAEEAMRMADHMRLVHRGEASSSDPVGSKPDGEARSFHPAIPAGVASNPVGRGAGVVGMPVRGAAAGAGAGTRASSSREVNPFAQDHRDAA